MLSSVCLYVHLSKTTCTHHLQHPAGSAPLDLWYEIWSTLLDHSPLPLPRSIDQASLWRDKTHWCRQPISPSTGRRIDDHLQVLAMAGGAWGNFLPPIFQANPSTFREFGGCQWWWETMVHGITHTAPRLLWSGWRHQLKKLRREMVSCLS